MAEVIAAIVGVLLGALVSWWVNRSRPHQIVCEDSFKARIALKEPFWQWSISSYTGTRKGVASFDLDIGLPQTQLLFKDKAVDVLTVLRLKFRNTSEKVIERPKIWVRLAESAAILGCESHVEPERFDIEPAQEVQSEPVSAGRNSCTTVIESNKAVVTLDSLYPHSANREVAILDIFCLGEVSQPEVSGQGVFQDGSAWAVKFEPWEESQSRVGRRVRAFNYVNTAGVLVGVIAFLIWQSPSGLIEVDTDAVVQLASHPFSLILAGWIVLFLCYNFYLLMRGWYMSLWIPFLRLRFLIYRIRYRRKRSE